MPNYAQKYHLTGLATKKIKEIGTVTYFACAYNKVSPERMPKVVLPFYLNKVPAGFPSPADDYIEANLNLNEYLIKHPAATFFMRMKGCSMKGKGIFDGDILVVDKSIVPSNGSLVIAVIQEQFLVRSYLQSKNGIVLASANLKYSNIEINLDSELQIWGTVTTVIHFV